ncbi:hypothetical protein [Zeaxanthinibacter enoshimensis]|uniref:Intein n=1 Tax=Zeaxanthinibacter enoshimensis TaxID=392009 RepID=A0A4R6TPW8_9FLAO|nr:hypothetical protein [Zeaxanthinibacter enoshimensis]TDQ31431.1 hypothetical protein CLV82_2139 [Zeaxanthinibacter enoshimensis]
MKNFKNIRLALLMTGAFSVTAFTMNAQENPEKSTMDQQEEIASETTKKTYKLWRNNEVIKNSVKISTEKKMAVMLADKDSNDINQERVLPKKQVMKTVEIDNDADDAYDERIKFRYDASATSDFVLISDKDEILVALENGENLEILEDQHIAKDNSSDNKDSYVFTDKNGKEVEFFIETYEDLDSLSNNDNTKKSEK